MNQIVTHFTFLLLGIVLGIIPGLIAARNTARYFTDKIRCERKGWNRKREHLERENEYLKDELLSAGIQQQGIPPVDSSYLEKIMSYAEAMMKDAGINIPQPPKELTLEEQLQQAIEHENFEEADRIRKLINDLK